MAEEVGPPCPRCGRPTLYVSEYDGIGKPALICSGCMLPAELCTCAPAIRMVGREPPVDEQQ